ncbi:MAG: hypothetical protein HY360_01595 [Verrucomicrobia bacterium]|nr:hypothetical protein [Verrucomicrobiota bacterium]
MRQRHVWILGALALAVTWIATFAAMWLARSQTMTAEKAAAWISERSLSSLSEDQRLRTIEELARRVNRLSFEERQKFRFERSLRSFYREMTDAERARYLDLTLSGGMKQMMDAFNKMTPDQRKRLVNRAMNELGRAQDETGRAELDKALNDQNIKRIVDQGLKTYFTDANASAKLDAQPLLEQMQSVLQTAK